VLHEGCVQLVDFEAGGFRGCGVVGDSKERIANAQNDPVAGGRGPVEGAVRMHFAGEVDDVALADGKAAIGIGRGELV